MKIYVIVRIWQDGKVELLEAYKNEKEAKSFASYSIPLAYEGFTIAIFTTKLMD